MVSMGDFIARVITLASLGLCSVEGGEGSKGQGGGDPHAGWCGNHASSCAFPHWGLFVSVGL
jgi:hypothetical protein